MRLIAVSVALLAARLASADPRPYCGGTYAEDLSALSVQAREIDVKAGTYSFAVRTTATFECVSYGSDGNLKRKRVTVLAHGTAFGYRRDGDDTLLLTNQHVAEWPAVTDAEHPVDNVPLGCKRVGDSLAIVDDDHDSYAADDVPLTRVVVDPELDIAILRAHAALGVIPWRVGKSAELAPRDAVEVRGFPLGEFRATNVGKVISAYDRDEQGQWNHDDFVVDALLTTGGSGSPVFAVSCKTGEPELVGVFHARYSNASALNVVVAIDQIRDLMTTLKRSPRPAANELDTQARARLVDYVRHAADPPFFSLGPFVASIAVRSDDTLVFTVFPTEFPRATQPLLVVEDGPAAAGSKSFGQIGKAYAGGDGLRACAATDGDAESQAALARVVGLLRQDALAAFDLRAANAGAHASRKAFEHAARLDKALATQLAAQRELGQTLGDLATKLSTRASGDVLTLPEIIAR